MHGCGDSSGMTGHHGWGYGQNDGRYRPASPDPLDLTPYPRAQSDFPDPQASTLRTGPGHPSGPAPRTQATCLTRALAPLPPCSWPKVRAATPPAPPPASHPAGERESCRLLRAARLPCSSGPGPRHSLTRGRHRGRRLPWAAGGGRGRAQCAGVYAGSAHGVCAGGPPGSQALLDKGAVSPGEFPRGSVRAFASAGM